MIDMPRQNRVNPFGELITTSARGTFMGNRGGALHDNRGMLTARRWISNRWIICLLEFKGRTRQVMTPGCYTELFFLDEATALAAGHRPCAECRREDFNRFKADWVAGNPQYGFSPNIAIHEIDKVLHAERADSQGRKITFKCQLSELPDGVFFTLPEGPESCYLLCDDNLHLWTPAGYGKRIKAPLDSEVEVLTPRSTVNAIQAGFEVCVGGAALAEPDPRDDEHLPR